VRHTLAAIEPAILLKRPGLLIAVVRSRPVTNEATCGFYPGSRPDECNKKGPATNGGAFKSRELFVSEGNEWVSLSTPDDLRLVIFSHSFVFSGRAVARTNDLRQAREQAASRFRAECERTNAAAVPSSAPDQVW
jgi:hypothetical protein